MVSRWTGPRFCFEMSNVALYVFLNYLLKKERCHNLHKSWSLVWQDLKIFHSLLPKNIHLLPSCIRFPRSSLLWWPPTMKWSQHTKVLKVSDKRRLEIVYMKHTLLSVWSKALTLWSLNQTAKHTYIVDLDQRIPLCHSSRTGRLGLVNGDWLYPSSK